jgi:CubicO group peptidase (beta-lactamase class C family)
MNRTRRFHRLLRLALIVLTPAAGCYHRVAVSVPASAMRSPSAFARSLAPLLARAGVAGVAVAVVRNGELWWSGGAGMANVSAHVPVSDSTVFQVASISKAVSAWGVMRLVERGALSLDDPVETWLTRWHFPPTDLDVRGVTVRRLLSHTAGLSENAYEGYPPDSALPSLEQTLSGRNDRSGAVTLVAQPGKEWSYSEGGYTVLQLLVEERTRQDFASYMQADVLEPLGMKSSAFVWRPELRPRTAIAYSALGVPEPNYLFIERAANGLYTTAPDLARFVAASMPGAHGEPPGRGVLSPATLALMESPAPATNGGQGLGYRIRHFANHIDGYGHGGTLVGWRALMIAVPARRAGLVVLTNSDVGDQITEPVFCAWARGVLRLATEGC